MSLFYNGELEEYLLFDCYFNMTLAASGTLEAGAKSQYLRTLVLGEALCQLYLLYADVAGIETPNYDYIIRGLAQYYRPVNSLSKQKRAMRRGMKKLRSLTARLYAAHLIGINEYLLSFPGDTLTDKIDVPELNEFRINSMPNSWL